MAHPTTTTDTTIAYNDAGLALSGAWAEVSGFNQTTDLTASLKLMFLGSQALLSMGTGPDHSRYDVYIDQTLWQSFDGYAPSPGQRDIALTLETDSRPLQSDGPHLLEIRSRAERSPQSSGHKLRFKQLLIEDRTWTLHTIGYTYDQLARLKEARYAPGIHRAAADANLLRHYRYNFDRAGNRTAQSIALNGASPTVTDYTYNAANQLVSDGTNTLTYDNNGNMTSDGVNSYVWDRANRLLSMGGASYQYDGEGRRTQQTVSSIVTKYLLDTQPGLAVVLSQTEGSDVTRFVHAPRGIHAHKDAAGAWEWMVQDGLGSVRGVADHSAAVLWSGSPAPYGGYFDETGTRQTHYGFTGEPMDDNGLLYLRARYYNPAAGVFTALDPFEGMGSRPMSLNGYLYVEGNVPNLVDPSGMCIDSAICQQLRQNGASYQHLLAVGCISSNDPCSRYPGWSYSHGAGTPDGYVEYCSNNRTLYPGGLISASELPTWWVTLSPTEKAIEGALAATSSCFDSQGRERAPFQHISEHTFDFVTGWISSNSSSIQEISAKVRVKSALVAGILASEMLFDYGTTDQLADTNLFLALKSGRSPNEGFGYANPHLEARIAAYDYLQPLVEIGAVDPVPTRLTIGGDIVTAYWLTQAEGAIWAAAAIGRFLVDPYKNTEGVSYQAALQLTPEEMATIWAAYRGGVTGLTTGGAFESVQQFRESKDACNAQISLPLMKYMSTLFQ